MGLKRVTGTVLSAALVALLAASPASAAPTCAEGPQTVGEAIVGTPCDDTIRAPRGVTTVFGEGGNDVLYGQRGNDSLFGGEGHDRLYGGIGDDHPRGGPGNDLLSGGFGGDSLDGESGDDVVRGDATIDSIVDSGGGIDTLSFATGVTPGFPNEGPVVAYANFPKSDGERGVFVELAGNFANNGLAPDGGGVDKPLNATTFGSFEKVVGTPFSDIIVGSPNAEAIYGGGGADVILGKEGGDQVFGGAAGDYCEATGATTASCEFSGSNKTVAPRDPSGIAVGLMTPAGAAPPGLYATGGSATDRVLATFSASPMQVTFELLPGSVGAFDAGTAGGCEPPAAGKVVCPLAASPDSIVLAGLGGDDALSMSGLPATTSAIVLGGSGGDSLSGDATEDAVIDGDGNDSVSAGGGDDAVPNNEGDDDLHADAGEDLFISDSVCEGDLLDGGSERDNANWANFDFPIAIDMGAQIAGLRGGDGGPDCDADPPSTLLAIEDVEGTSLGDTLIGDAGPNQLLGRPGADAYFAAAGNDSILANSGDADVTIDCGEGFDTAQVDHPEYGDPAPIGCESIHERDPNSFRPPDTPPDPDPGPPTGEASAAPSPPVVKPPRRRAKDRTPPRTRLLRRPSRQIFAAERLRRVVFAFASNETGSTFRCKLDRDRFRPCRSPRTYRLLTGRHTFRVAAIDRAGNRDPSPVFFAFRIRRR